jgi:hypothetical protein
MSEKITGYSLLFLGIGIMFFCVINIFMVFTNKMEPFSYFNIASSSGEGNPLNISNLMKQIQGGNQDALNTSIALPKTDLIPSESLNQMLNLSTQFFLMTFILGFGYKLANLGVQLVRPINVKLKSAPEIPPVILPSQPPQPPLRQI